MTRPPAPVTERRPNLPPDFADLITRSLEKKPADRWQSAAELLPKLDALSSSTAGMTPAHTHAVPAAPSGRTAAGWIFGGLAVAVIFAVAIIGYALIAPSLRGAVELGQRARVTLESALELDPALSPDGRFLAYAASEGGGEFKIFVRQTESGTPIAVAPDLTGSQRLPAWSPDGERLTFVSNRGVEVVSALGGVPRTVATGDSVGAASWSPDGQQVAVVRGRGVTVVTVADGQERELVGRLDLHSPAWSPDGRWIAYVEGNQTGVRTPGNISPSAIEIVPAEGGDALTVTDAIAFNASPTWLDSSTLVFVSDRDGGRDVYTVDVARDGAVGSARRITTGLSALSVHASADGTRLGYSVFNDRSNVWTMPIPDAGPAPASTATPLTTGSQIIEMLDVSSDGQWLAFDSNRSGNQDIFRQPIAGGPLEQLTTDPADDFGPAFSPDMTELAFYSYRGAVPRQLLVMPTAGGPVTRLLVDDIQATGPRWSPDGTSLLMRTWSSTLTVIRRNNGAWGSPEAVADRMTGSFAEWSPDGQTIAYSSAGMGEGLRLVSATGGNGRTLHVEPEADGPQYYPQWSSDGRHVYFLDLQATGIHRIPAEGGTPELLVEFDAARPWHRYGFRAVNGQFYFTLGELESDLWVADVVK
jgi:Tol biopolymer transport system component